MKQQVAQKRTAQIQARRRAAAVEPHERQARDAAARILRGESDVSRLLTSRPAARPVPYAGQSAAAEGLPAAAKERLERGFGANLAAVRIHHEGATSALVAADGARAFTSGRDIYFAPGTYQPDTNEGLRLLAHEIAHVLQQTGRTDGGGTWVATDRRGSADVQRDDPPAPPTRAWSTVREDYRTQAAGEAEPVRDALETMIGTLESLVGATATLSTTLGVGVETTRTTSSGRTETTNNMTTFENRVKAGDFNSSHRIARSLLFDTLKLLGRYEGAAYLLDRDRLLPTNVSHAAFFAFLQTDPRYGLDWLAATFPDLPAIQPALFPDRFLENIYRYLINPQRSPVASSDVRQAVTDYDAAYAAARASQFFFDNERVVGAWRALNFINEDLQRNLQDLERQILEAPPAQRRQAAARHVLAAAERWALHPRRLYRRLSEPTANIARQALELWTTAELRQAEQFQAAERLFSSLFTAPGSGPRPGMSSQAGQASLPSSTLVEIPATVQSNAVFARFLQQTKTHLQAVLSTTAATLPGPEAYVASLAALRTALVAGRSALGSETFRIFTRRDANDPAKFDRAVWFGVAQYFIEGLLLVLDEYDANRDAHFVATYGGLPDERLRSRFLIARYAYQLGALTSTATAAAPGSLDIQAIAADVLTGADVNQSFLAFSGDWMNDHAPAEDMARDFNPGTPVKGWGLSVNQIQRIFYLLYERALVSSLRGLLLNYGNNLTPATYGLIQNALRAARDTVPMPTRWVPQNYVFVWNAVDAAVPERANTMALIENHPRFAELLAVEDHANEAYVIPDFRAERPYVWFLPNFQRLVDYVHTIAPVREGLEAAFLDIVTPERLLDYLDFLAREDREATAAERARTGNPDATVETLFDQLMAQLNAQLGTDIDTIQAERDRLFTAATIHDRRVIQLEAERLLGIYAANNLVENYTVPNQVMDLIERFRGDIHPESERDAQMAALILALGDEMLAAFVQPLGFIFSGVMVEERYDIVTNYFGYIMEALAFLGRQNAGSTLGAVLDASENAETLARGAAPLMTLRGHFLAVIQRIQQQFGFRTNPDGTALTRVDTAREVRIGQVFTIDGITYRIKTIHRQFIFHDSYGRNTAAYQPSILKHPDGTEFTRAERDANLPLVTYEILPAGAEALEPEPAAGGDGGEVDAGTAADPQAAAPQYPTFTLTSSLGEANEVALEQLAHAVTMQSIVQGLEATLAAIEAFGQGLMTAAEIAAMFVPGGPIALLILDFGRFLLVELPKLRTEIFEEPLRLVSELRDFVSPELRDQMIERLWTYLLFEGDLPFLEQIQARLSSQRRERESRPAASGRVSAFARLARFAKTVGRLLLQAFLNLRQRVRVGMIRAHDFVERHPLLARLTRMLPALFEYADMVRASDVDAVRDFLGDLADGNGPELVSNHLRSAMDELFDGLNGLEVPAEILPMGPVLEVLLDRFVGSLGVRGRIVRTFLHGARDLTNGQFDPMRELSDLLASRLQSAGLDPNILWAELIRGDLQALLENTRTDVIAGVNTLFEETLGGVIRLDTGNLSPITVRTDAPGDGSTPAVAPLLDDTEDENEDSDATTKDGAWLRPPAVLPAQGRPLAAPLRHDYEQRFGHDFRHVRVHYDNRAAQLTRYYRARALTSGSHIFLSQELPPGSPRTESVLKHELAHVLQQTGSRPLNMAQRPEPILGEPGRGLQVDPRREAAAQRMAQAASFHRDQPLPVEEEKPRSGLFPSMSQAMIKRTIDYLGSDRIEASFVHQIESLHSIPGEIATERRGEFNTAVSEAAEIWRMAREKLLLSNPPSNALHANKATFNSSFARAGIRQYFSSTFDLPTVAASNPRLRALAFYSFQIRNDRLRLNVGQFKQNLTNYIDGVSGIKIVIDPFGAKVDFVRVDDIDLDTIHAGTTIYRNMKTKTNERMAGIGSPPPVPRHLPAAPVPFTETEWLKIRENFGASDVAIWDTNEYRLSDDFIGKMREMLDAVVGGSVDTWDNYTTPTAVSDATFGGLRVGTHGQLSGAPTGQTSGAYITEPASGPGAGSMSSVARGGRQSHHVPQYLLVEYFQNLDTSSVKIAQRDGGRTLFPPGFQVAGNLATGFQGAGKSIDFAHLDPGGASDRGRGLPAISLAARTHQKGQLHINLASNWGNLKDPNPNIEVQGTPAQGLRLHRIFYDLLRQKMRPSPTSDDPAAILRAANSAPTTHTSAVYEALRDTYMWMYRGMMFSLERVLTRDLTHAEQYEATMYRSFALGNQNTQTAPNSGVLKPDYTPNIALMARVITAIKEKNRDIMSEWYKA